MPEAGGVPGARRVDDQAARGGARGRHRVEDEVEQPRPGLRRQARARFEDFPEPGGGDRVGDRRA
ncbi:hypothetical protein ABZ816_24440 [Actinosynnema sp. NPDC047251]|uniref:Uncharacterized protein n=1 Tax=Saccharothrix espanaensis (strain ATCC 51144 / DSM 44229 / JCM 9112 / NBRC 15066 / NRRL 15764) TaxID=1179773 RepID=K0K6Z5_SACES|nr:hypothetical protein [Saccharothrix espanaensis]CCH32373.1 hypothetical protein BN6_51070 [Saccharothrix espanaensis DSM 44229]